MSGAAGCCLSSGRGGRGGSCHTSRKTHIQGTEEEEEEEENEVTVILQHGGATNSASNSNEISDEPTEKCSMREGHMTT